MEPETLNVSILNRTYRLRVGADQAEALKKAAEMLDSTAKLYGRKFVYKDYQDLLAMVALTQMERLLEIDRQLRVPEEEIDVAVVKDQENLQTDVIG